MIINIINIVGRKDNTRFIVINYIFIKINSDRVYLNIKIK